MGGEVPVQMTHVKLVTIIAKAVIEEHLIREIRSLGAKGFTTSEVRGEGSRGRRLGDAEGANVLLGCLVSAETAERTIVALSERYFEYYAIVVFVQGVSVVRGDKEL